MYDFLYVLMMFDVLRFVQGFVIDVLGMYQECCKKCQGCFRDMLGRFGDAIRMFQGCCRDMLGRCQVSFRNVLGVFQGSVRNVLGMFQRCFRYVLGMCQACFKHMSIILFFLLIIRLGIFDDVRLFVLSIGFPKIFCKSVYHITPVKSVGRFYKKHKTDSCIEGVVSHLAVRDYQHQVLGICIQNIYPRTLI